MDFVLTRCWATDTRRDPAFVVSVRDVTIVWHGAVIGDRGSMVDVFDPRLGEPLGR